MRDKALLKGERMLSSYWGNLLIEVAAGKAMTNLRRTAISRTGLAMMRKYWHVYSTSHFAREKMQPLPEESAHHCMHAYV